MILDNHHINLSLEVPIIIFEPPRASALSPMEERPYPGS